VDEQKVLDPFYVQFNGPAKCAQNMLDLVAVVDPDRAYTVAFTVDSATPKDIFGAAVTMTDGRCEETATQKLEVLVAGTWLEFNPLNAEQMPYIASYTASLTDPQFTFQMNKELYATTFTGAAETEIWIRILTVDSLSASALGTVTDKFKIDVSLGCMDDRIVAPDVLPQVDMVMTEPIATPVIVNLSGYASEDPNCRAYAGITIDIKNPDTGVYASATADATRLAYLPTDETAETLTVQDPSFDAHESFMDVRVTYRTGAQAAGIDTRVPETREF
jgi:hypothetical protein